MGVLQAGWGGEHSTAVGRPAPTPGRVPSRGLASMRGSMSPGVSLSHPCRVRPVWPLPGIPSKQPEARRPCTAGAGGWMLCPEPSGAGGQHLEQRRVCTQFSFGLWLISSGWAPSPLSLRIREAGPGGCRRSATRLRSCQPQAGAAVRAGPAWLLALAFPDISWVTASRSGPHRTTVPGSRLPLCILQLPSRRFPRHCPGSARCWPCGVYGAKGQATCPEGSGKLIKVKSLKRLRHLNLKLGSTAGAVGVCWCPGRGLTPWRGGACRATRVARGAAEPGIQKLGCA